MAIHKGKTRVSSGTKKKKPSKPKAMGNINKPKKKKR